MAGPSSWRGNPSIPCLEAGRARPGKPSLLGFSDREKTPLDSTPTEIYTLSLHDALPISVPYLVAPEEITPGRSYSYASTCGGCSAGCGLLVKNRDGRPIKLEGNPEHPLSRGGLCAAGQASLLGLYDQQRLQHPLQGGQQAEWPDVDKAIGQHLTAIRKQKGHVRCLTGPVVSPTTRRL